MDHETYVGVTVIILAIMMVGIISILWAREMWVWAKKMWCAFRGSRAYQKALDESPENLEFRMFVTNLTAFSLAIKNSDPNDVTARFARTEIATWGRRVFVDDPKTTVLRRRLLQHMGYDTLVQEDSGNQKSRVAIYCSGTWIECQ